MSLNRNGFQTRVNRVQPPPQRGSFASQNPRASWLAGGLAFRASSAATTAGTDNPIIGNFAWATQADELAHSQKPVGASVRGFIAYELQTVIPFLAPGAGVDPVQNAVFDGFPVTGYVAGDFWTTPDTPLNGIVSAGDTVYANPDDGSCTNDPTFFSATGVQTAASSTVTISAVTKGRLTPGAALLGTGLGTAPIVTAQLTGTAGGAGTYTLNETTGFASATVTVAPDNTGYLWASNTTAGASFTGVIDSNGVLTVSALTGVVGIGQNISGAGVPQNLFVQGQLTGTAGAAGTYQTNTLIAVASVAMTTSEGQAAKISRVAT